MDIPPPINRSTKPKINSAVVHPPPPQTVEITTTTTTTTIAQRPLPAPQLKDNATPQRPLPPQGDVNINALAPQPIVFKTTTNIPSVSPLASNGTSLPQRPQPVPSNPLKVVPQIPPPSSSQHALNTNSVPVLKKEENGRMPQPPPRLHQDVIPPQVPVLPPHVSAVPLPYASSALKPQPIPKTAPQVPPSSYHVPQPQPLPSKTAPQVPPSSYSAPHPQPIPIKTVPQVHAPSSIPPKTAPQIPTPSSYSAHPPHSTQDPSLKKPMMMANENEKKVVMEHVEVHIVVDGVPSLISKDSVVKLKQTGGSSGVLELDKQTIPLNKDVPTLCVIPSCYLFITPVHQFYLIKLSTESQEIGELLESCSTYHQPKVVVATEVVGETENTQNASAAADKIESGGTAISEGLIKGAQFLGSGIKKTSHFVISHTDKGNKEVTEEDKKRIEQNQQTTQTFLNGTRTVVGGIGKGAKFLGHGIAKIATSVSPKDDKPPEPESASKAAAKKVAGSTMNALGSIKTGICEGTKIVASDIRENAVEVRKHREGEESAKLMDQQFHMAGQVAVGTIHTVNIATTASHVTLNVACSVGANAITYDADQSKLMEGPGWIAGWMCSQDNTLDPWTSKWFVLRTYAMSMYKDNQQDPLKPIFYLPLLEIKTVELVEFAITKKRYCFKIITKSTTLFLSLECTDKDYESLGYDARNGEECEKRMKKWMQSLTNLSKICKGEISL